VTFPASAAQPGGGRKLRKKQAGNSKSYQRRQSDNHPGMVQHEFFYDLQARV